uniref:Uncharacterized protein n=1 Tax=Candidatus Kentrum sp. TC TaxID=2126339 RepID=A0A450Z6V6_9GAMM|nr:MAG: hypothetical protein BECKTC1821E_GA0114239_10754 [Candidatus Kentron sp. TC]VFK49531.1 MAG: hypothetical protein BECKTC1821D_GA0114238_108012 [Candidatus Kentron sp. TC]
MVVLAHTRQEASLTIDEQRTRDDATGLEWRHREIEG